MHNERCRERRTLVTLSRTLGFVRWGDCVHGASVLVTLSKYLVRERERRRNRARSLLFHYRFAVILKPRIFRLKSQIKS